MIRTLTLLVQILVLTAAIASAAPEKKNRKEPLTAVQSVAPTLPEAQVILDDKPLLTIKTKVLSFSPEDRAIAISSRLAKLAHAPLFHVDSLKVVDIDTTSDIAAGDMVMMSVTDADAQAAGKLFSLGSTSAISNIVAGVVLTYMRAFKLGDRVKIADTVGDVVEKTLLATRVRTIKKVDITIPNAMILGSHIINFSSSVQESGLILNTTVTIGYDAPWRRVHELADCGGAGHG